MALKITAPAFFCLASSILLSGCAQAAKKDKSALSQQVKLAQFSDKICTAFELGKTLSQNDEGFVERLEDQVLSETLREFYSPYAGAKRLLAYKDQRPDDPLNSVFLSAGVDGSFFEFEGEEDFRSGTYFNAYDKTLFVPFFRSVLLHYLEGGARTEESNLELAKILKLAGRLTPRYAGYYPNQLEPETRREFEKSLLESPEGIISDRLRFLLLWDERNGAWATKRAALDGRLRQLKDGTRDELLKLEIADALQAQGPAPEQAFWMSMALPGLGQISNGDLQGGLLLGGLTAAAWVWLVNKLRQADRAPDDASKAVAYGDAAWAGALAALGHGFTAYNASEQARFINIMIEWDLLSRPRLKF